MCKCGCGTCETKITGPLLTESKVKSLLSEGLNHHISNAIPLHETVYRYGSVKHLSLIKEARKLYSRNVIDLNEFDAELVKTHLGEWGLFENESVPLDLPMMNEREDALGIYDDGRGNSAAIEWTPNGYLATVEGEQDFQIGPTKTVEELIKMLAAEGFTNKIFEETTMQGNPNLRMGTYAGRPVVVNTMGTEDMTKWKATFLNTGKRVDFADVIANIKLDEAKKAKKKKKDPPIGKPKRGGSKAYYVYVRDPKTKKIKKVSFGSGGLRAKINNPKARNAFAKRHRCSTKNDRTKPGYWSCRLPRYAKALGLGNNKNTFW